MSDARLTDIEIHLSHLDATIEELNQALIRQQRYIESMEQDIATLKARLQAAGISHIAAENEETPPPHY